MYQVHKVKFDSLESQWGVQLERQFAIDEKRLGCGSATLVELFTTKWERLMKEFDSYRFFVSDSLPKLSELFYYEVGAILKDDANRLGRQEKYDLVIDVSSVVYSNQGQSSVFSDSYVESFNSQLLIEKFENRLLEKYALYSKILAQSFP